MKVMPLTTTILITYIRGYDTYGDGMKMLLLVFIEHSRRISVSTEAIDAYSVLVRECYKRQYYMIHRS